MRDDAAPDPSPTRTFGVEEELLLVDAVTMMPVARGDLVVAAAAPAASGHVLETEFKREQLEVVSPPQRSLQGQLDAIRAGRALADAAAASFGARAVALSTCPWPLTSSLVGDARYDRMADRFGITAVEQLTCGLHVHVGIASREEGVAVLDRVRVWLPVLLALSANSPFWSGLDTGFASYRYQAWSRWPTAGPGELFGSAEAYDRHCRDLLVSGVPLDAGMLYFDARLSARYPTVEVRVADVCLVPEHAAALAVIVRALVETVARQWRAGMAAPAVSAAVLRAWSWQASRFGMAGELVSPLTRRPAASGEVAAQLLELIDPVLAGNGEQVAVAGMVGDVVGNGTGAARQRGFRSDAADSRSRRDLKAVVEGALAATHEGVAPAIGRDESAGDTSAETQDAG